jgi:hypothetical protein
MQFVTLHLGLPCLVEFDSGAILGPGGFDLLSGRRVLLEWANFVEPLCPGPVTLIEDRLPALGQNLNPTNESVQKRRG